jgi:uncharacterized SAM-binding protein YcdF (DUF218 family)
MDSVFASLGLSALKPLLSTLLLPPVPLLLLVLLAGRVLATGRRLAGWLLLLGAVAGLWLSCCASVGAALERWWLKPPPALSEARLAALRPTVPGRPGPVVVILGSGRDALAPEYGESHLSARSMQRLHYGLWLARRIGAPVLFSGGTGLAQAGGPAEADIAARIAERDYGRRLRWVESASRDTRENAAASLRLLAEAAPRELVLVTHGWHMRRAQRAFEEAVERNGLVVQVVPAPIGLAPAIDRQGLAWLPTQEGFEQVRRSVREALGLLFGA